MTVEPGLYRHHKGEHYVVLGVSRHTETGEEFVTYFRSFGEGRMSDIWEFEQFALKLGGGEVELFSRPLAMFLENVDQKIPRFARV